MTPTVEETKDSLDYIDFMAKDMSNVDVERDINYAINNRFTLKQFFNDGIHIEDITYIKRYKEMTLVYCDLDVYCIDCLLTEALQDLNDYYLQTYKTIAFLRVPKYHMFVNANQVMEVNLNFIKFDMSTIPFHHMSTLQDVERFKSGIEMLLGS